MKNMKFHIPDARGDYTGYIPYTIIIKNGIDAMVAGK